MALGVRVRGDSFIRDPRLCIDELRIMCSGPHEMYIEELC